MGALPCTLTTRVIHANRCAMLCRAVLWCRTLSLQVESWFKLPLGKQEPPRAPLTPGPAGTAAPLGPLIPELAQLQWAEDIMIIANKSTVYAGIPIEWGLPSAFPRIRRWVPGAC